MKRLTTKIKGSNNYCEFELKNAKYKNLFELSSNREIENYVNTDLTIAIDKLGQLEDIEEELGIDLITLFKALKNGFWSIDKKNHIYKMKPTEGNGGAMSFYASYDCIIKENAYDEQYFLLKDYGKTWALTKEELKNGND